jgi:FKBP-type peptidyl-prolyl cis-trans isomerase SlyD
MIQEGKQVSFDYTLTVEDKIVDTSKEKGPLKYTHGKGEIIPGLEKNLEGLKVGDEKLVIVPPEEAYGQLDPRAFREVEKSSLPQDIKVGMNLQAQSADGQVFVVKIAEIKNDMVVVDFNHPLAGKTLKFDVKIVSIE